MALRAAGIDPAADCKTTHMRQILVQTKLGQKPMLLDTTAYGVRMTSRSAVQAALIEYCLERYPATKWVYEHKFLGVV